MCVWGFTITKRPKPVLTMTWDEQKNAGDHHEKNFSSNRDVNECEQAEGSVCHCISLFKYPTSKKPLYTSNKFSSLLSISRQGHKKERTKTWFFVLCLSKDYWMDSFCSLKGLLGGSVHTKDQGAGNSFVFSRHKTLEKMNWKNFQVKSRCPVGSFSISVLILMSCLASPDTAHMN